MLKLEEPITKFCPYCLSEIPYKAVKCSHCASDINIDEKNGIIVENGGQESE